MGEKALLEREMLQPGVTLFRNDNGTAWVGGREMVAKADGVVKVKKGDRLIIGASRLSYGLQVGSGDGIGWTERDGVAVFTSVEIKTAGDSISREQILWHQAVLKAGGISRIVQEGVELTMAQVMALPRRSSVRAVELDRMIGGGSSLPNLPR